MPTVPLLTQEDIAFFKREGVSFANSSRQRGPLAGTVAQR